MLFRAPSLLILVAALVAACETVPAEQRAAACQATDWYSYGLNDGVLGVASGQRVKQFADCTELGHPADVAAYQAGRAEGLALYCTVENGYDIGYGGRPYRDVCPPELEPAFLQGYDQGKRDRPINFNFHFGLGYYHGSHRHYRHHH
jgi:hypothetical protein